MLTFLFWNLKGKALYEQISSICYEDDVDILIFAESNTVNGHLLDYINIYKTKYFVQVPDPNPNPRFTIFVNHEKADIHIKEDDGRFYICHLLPKAGPDILLTLVHLPSKLHHDPPTLAHHSRRVAERVINLEKQFGHNRTIIVGDFNMNPFEHGMIECSGFHAIMDCSIALRRSGRTVSNEYFNFFYNPMWGRIGDRSPGPPGTHYYNNSSNTINYLWNTYDQFIFRPEIANLVPIEYPQVKTIAGKYNLLSQIGIPDARRFSDHLPIILKIDTTKGVIHHDG